MKISNSQHHAGSELNARQPSDDMKTRNSQLGLTAKIDSAESTALSGKSKALSTIDQELTKYLNDNPLPRYFSTQTHNERIAEKVLSLGHDLGIELDAGDVDSLVEAHARRTPLNLSFDSGNVFDFLKESDRLELEKEHQYALDNGTSLDDVGHTAFEMGVKRHREAREAQGTRFVELDKDADFGAFLLNIEQGGDTTGVSQVEAGSKEYQELIERFSDNPILMEIFFKHFIK